MNPHLWTSLIAFVCFVLATLLKRLNKKYNTNLRLKARESGEIVHYEIKATGYFVAEVVQMLSGGTAGMCFIFGITY